jgi:propanediol dehydratase medium subunit
MKVTEEMIREIILEVLRDMGGDAGLANPDGEASPPLEFKLVGPAKQGMDKNEVVVAIPPAFGTVMTKTIIGIPHGQVLREITAGIEEEGLKARIVKVNRTADVAFMSHEAARLSGSGIGIGVQSRGTAVIHQKDLKPLQNLELFSQSPLLDLATFRAMGRNAAKYAKGESPRPVPIRNDPMARPRYQGLAALLYNKEVQYLNPDKPSEEVTVRL